MHTLIWRNGWTIVLRIGGLYEALEREDWGWGGGGGGEEIEGEKGDVKKRENGAK